MCELVLVLGWTQCLLQGVGAPPAMLRGRTAGLPKKLGGRASGEAGQVDTICTVPPPRLWHTNHEQAVSVWCNSVSFIRLLGVSLVVMEWQTFPGALSAIQLVRMTGLSINGNRAAIAGGGGVDRICTGFSHNYSL